jgi:multiple sugar transport system substrate-binding protein
MSKLTDTAFEPKYLQIKNILAREIAGGKYRPGDKIPSENVLPGRFNVSRLTVVKAVEELEREGILERVRGSGTFVAERKKKTVLTIGAFSDNAWLYDLFEEAHPDIEISKVIYTHDNFYDVIEHSRSDLFYLTEFYLDYMVANRKLLDLTEPLGDLLFDKPVVYDEVLRLFEHRRKQYAMPFLFSPVMLFLNKKLFERFGVSRPESGWNWDSFVQTAKKMRSREPDTFGFIFAQYRNRWPVYIIQNGGEVIDREGQCAIGSPESVEAIQWIADLLFKHKVCPLYPNMTQALANSLFNDGKSAMILDTYYSLAGHLGQKNISLDTAPMPRGKNDVTGLVADAFGVSAQSKNTDAALKFVRFSLSDDIQSKIKRNACGIPSVRHIAASRENIPDGLSSESYLKFTGEVAKGRKMISISDPRRLEPLWHELDKVWAGMTPPETAYPNAEKLLGKERQK